MTKLDEELERLSKAATQGVWRYRPDQHDDWGIVKSPVAPDGFACVLAQFRDPDALDNETLARHREAKTDPWEANARFVTTLVNAYRTGQLVPAQPSDILSPDAIRDCLVTTVLATPAQPSGDVVEAVALAIMVTNGACFVKDWTTERRDNPHVALAWDQATAAITAYEAASGVAKMRLECLEMSEKLQDAEEEVAALTKAMHDAINAPKGVVPASAEAFYDPARAALGEKP